MTAWALSDTTFVVIIIIIIIIIIVLRCMITPAETGVISGSSEWSLLSCPMPASLNGSVWFFLTEIN
jgi:hypothetical protein